MPRDLESLLCIPSDFNSLSIRVASELGASTRWSITFAFLGSNFLQIMFRIEGCHAPCTPKKKGISWLNKIKKPPQSSIISNGSITRAYILSCPLHCCKGSQHFKLLTDLRIFYSTIKPLKLNKPL